MGLFFAGVGVTDVQEHSCLVSLGLCSVTSLHPSVKGSALFLPGTAFVLGIVVFCIDPELVLDGKVAHPPCANRGEAAPFQCGQLGCFTLLFQALCVVFHIVFSVCFVPCSTKLLTSPDPPLLITVCPGDFNLFDFYMVAFFVLIREKGNNLFLVI